jgi:hypothetical protein
MQSAGFEPAIPAIMRLLTNDLDRLANGISVPSSAVYNIQSSRHSILNKPKVTIDESR